jgi:voltage-gated potassium channel
VLGAKRITEVPTRPAVVDFVEMASAGADLELDQVQVPPGSPLIGVTLRDAGLREKFGVMVVAIRMSGGETVYNPPPNVELSESDMLVVIGPSGATANLRDLQDAGLEASPPDADESN